MRVGEACLVLVLLCLASGCSFVRYRWDEGEQDYRAITELLAELPGSRASGMTAEEWWDQRGRGVISPVDTWGRAEAALYAARSCSRIRHNPYVSMSLTVFEVGVDGMRSSILGGGGLVLFAAIAAPLDLILLPCWYIAGPIRETSVRESHLREAVRDLLRARDLGYESARVEQDTLFGAPTWAFLHLDQIGYDRRWLADRECLCSTDGPENPPLEGRTAGRPRTGGVAEPGGEAP